MYNKSTKRREDRKKKEEMFEVIMADDFPNLVKNNYPHIREAQQTPKRTDSKRSMPRHIIVKLHLHI